jgi:hypothetical protein
MSSDGTEMEDSATGTPVHGYSAADLMLVLVLALMWMLWCD